MGETDFNEFKENVIGSCGIWIFQECVLDGLNACGGVDVGV